ncbi:Low molecular weight phosphotyrosine protein phosphatase [Tritrichomonas foetus]|uniref:Low molecular weight phosphotyrosine protein phosphatase n=1 Tax=Tritrichomonas foetus TaxID=1144522 RepID=A0A1J4KPL0_9EUKA|nr:Low molecular weight phosphotyrosine protein phosphatase [Tritrichomonas foetus]|eukprot:OHT12840.1 Low molecular weight phosphotyrosine protein phosphatase [Tritrichomonas foetus]
MAKYVYKIHTNRTRIKVGKSNHIVVKNKKEIEMAATRKSVLFVCLGNICRSPTCEGICRLISQGEVDAQSASTSSWHRNECPDERSQEICMKHGIDISGHRARAIRNDDWEYFDIIAALDQKVLDVLKGMRPEGQNQGQNENQNDSQSDSQNTGQGQTKAKLVLFNPPDGVGDPYYGGRSGFQKMFTQIYNAMGDFLLGNGLIEKLPEKY